MIVIIMIFLSHINSLTNTSPIKIGIKNKFVKVLENQTIFRIKTNLFNLNISIIDLKNITDIIISENNNLLENTINNSSNSNSFNHCNLL